MRTVKTINTDWRFSKTATTAPVAYPEDWEAVTLPHTWNGEDGQDGGNDYYRGTCFYAKKLLFGDFPEGQVHYLQFDGVNSSATVWFNGERLCTHDGGYSTFRAKLPEVKEENLLVVAADNAPNDRVYPQVADFTFYGGIYRDVTLIAVPENHFDLDYCGAPGIQVTPTVKGDKAEVNVKTYVTGAGEVQVTVDGQTLTGTDVTFTIENPHLWNGVKDPFLYTATASLLLNGEPADEISARFGIRSYEIHPEKGFLLNGKEYPLRGVSRHQDYPKIGNALGYEQHKQDVDLILELGATTVRLAHYQHSQTFYDLCDEAGLCIWAEIPYISRHMENGMENTLSQMKELIAQNYNHPCIVVWGLSNEITMGGADDPSLLENHRKLNDLAHSMDATRPTTEACVTVCNIDEAYVHIPDVVSYNHYFGWYGGSPDMNGPWFDTFHKKYPDTPIGISEYGCEALNWHTSNPTQGDYTEEYQAYYHEELIKQIADRPYLWATHVWNMFDFAADARAEGGENGMNHKGLVTFDRQYKKDAFYAYQAWLSDKPMVHLCAKRYIDRTEDVTKVTVYSNQPEVELFANGSSVGKQAKGKYPFFYFEVKNEGETALLAKAGDLCDASVIRKAESMNPDYVMQEEGAVINWFEIETPPGYLSVNDTLGDILATPKGKLFLIPFVKALKKGLSSGDSSGTSVMGMKMDTAMIKTFQTMKNLVYGFTVKRVISMSGAKLTKEEILALNRRLNKIKKK